MKRVAIALIVLIGLVITPIWHANALIIPIDLNDFFADPAGDVSIAPDGSSATLTETSGSSTILLSNDPFLGDPGIPVPTDLLSLNFNFSLTVGNGNFDFFDAVVYDGDAADFTPLNFTGAGSGAGVVAGHVSWDLSGIDPAITLLGLDFQLNSDDSLFDSFVTISDVHLVTAAPVPEPATMILVGTGLAGLLGIRRKKFRN